MKLNYFNFKEFDSLILLTNDFGNYLFVKKDEFKKILKRDIELDSDLGKRLIKYNFIFDESSYEHIISSSYKLREVKNHLNMATSLHIFVVTTACNMKCVYCQANSGKQNTSLFMTREIAKKAVDIALQSPTNNLSFEFQGGEPLLNFEIIRFIVEYTETKKEYREIQYNIVTNLSLITEEILDFFVKYHFGVSTSLDGQEDLHNQNRPFIDGMGTFSTVKTGIRRIKERGLSIGAIQTTTRGSLAFPKEIVRTYKELGFSGIFLRPLTLLGKAKLNWDDIGYSAEDFLEFYQIAFNEILEINREGYFMKEDHASIFIKKIQSNFINYMELRSPCGAGIGQIAYYADGDIFTCDEGRMLHEMGDHTFRLGNVYESNYNDLINNSVCKTVCAASTLETIPGCCDCVYQPYCGTCPVVNYANYNDVLVKEPWGYRCKIYSGILDLIFKVLKNQQQDNIEILQSWEM